MTEPLHVLGIAGSLRTGSYNRAALRAAAEVLPDGLSLEILDLAAIPLYSADLDTPPLPEPVRLFKAAIAKADALLIATPEYNYSIPGVLKNALDWASRPPSQSPLSGKPVAIMGASTGQFGTVRAQAQLRQVCLAANMLPVSRPEVYIAHAATKFDADGNLVDEDTRTRIHKLLVALADWCTQLRRSCCPVA